MISPTLFFDFTAGSLDPRITFARSGDTATTTNSSGYIVASLANNPRFNFDAITLACKGLLIEGQQTNLLLRSRQFSFSSWTKANASFAVDAAISPDGTQNSEKFIATVTNGQHRVDQVATVTSGVTYTLSVYAKAAEYPRIWLRAANDRASAFFDLTTGQVSQLILGSALITPAGNGWYRCSVTGVATTTGAAINSRINIATAISESFAGDGVSGVFVWGAQLEAGAEPSSYIPTTTVALTRNPDVATITGTNFSDWWQAGKGGVQGQATPSTVSGIRPLVQFDDGTANEIIALRGNTTNPELYIVDGGTPQAQLDAGTIAANTAYSLTGWWQTNDCKARKDSGAVVTDATATIPTVTQARIGSDGTNYLNGTIATINYYDTFLGQPIYTRRKNKVFSSLL